MLCLLTPDIELVGEVEGCDRSQLSNMAYARVANKVTGRRTGERGLEVPGMSESSAVMAERESHPGVGARELVSA